MTRRIRVLVEQEPAETDNVSTETRLLAYREARACARRMGYHLAYVGMSPVDRLGSPMPVSHPDYNDVTMWRFTFDAEVGFVDDEPITDWAES